MLVLLSTYSFDGDDVVVYHIFCSVEGVICFSSESKHSGDYSDAEESVEVP